MAFKEGDTIIHINNPNIELCMSDNFKLDVGKRFIVKSISIIGEYIRIDPHPDETYTNIKNLNGLYSINRFIHEKDWIRRIKYGV